MIDPVTISVASLGVACVSVGFGISSFAWQHWRKKNAVTCSVVAADIPLGSVPKEAAFQFSFANLGSRAVLVNSVSVSVSAFSTPGGVYSFQCKLVEGKLPQILNAGQMCSIVAKAEWNITMLCQAIIEGRKASGDELFFTVGATASTPEGTHLSGDRRNIGRLKMKQERLAVGIGRRPVIQAFAQKNSLNLYLVAGQNCCWIASRTRAITKQSPLSRTPTFRFSLPSSALAASESAFSSPASSAGCIVISPTSIESLKRSSRRATSRSALAAS